MFKKSYRFGFIKHTSTGNKTATYEVVIEGEYDTTYRIWHYRKVSGNENFTSEYLNEVSGLVKKERIFDIHDRLANRFKIWFNRPFGIK